MRRCGPLGAIVAAGQRLLDHAQLPRQLLLQLFHLLPINLELLIRVAENEANIAGRGAQAEDLAAAVEGAFGAHAARAVRGVVVDDAEWKGGIDDDAVFVTLLDLRVNGDRELPGEVDNDIAIAGLQVAHAGLLGRGDEPGGDAAGFGGGFDGAFDLGEVDAAAAGFETGGAGDADDADAAAAGFRADEAGGFADFDLAAGGVGEEERRVLRYRVVRGRRTGAAA